MKCVNYKNQADCIIDPVCRLFSGRGMWEADFTVMCTDIKLRYSICLKKKKSPLPSFFFYHNCSKNTLTSKTSYKVEYCMGATGCTVCLDGVEYTMTVFLGSSTIAVVC